ncbi:hypothetical protein VTN77DRAFT_6133 [Rasamsonia byssochlamydoides]|uniref:uncharacterized protein n=1 Tax=Rasamsonia byssochlamydoides TaxID=89139 RepID=UPI003742354B
MCRGRMKWVVSKGQKIDENFTVTAAVQAIIHEDSPREDSLNLYFCPLEDPPEHLSHCRILKVGTIKTDLSNIDLKTVESKYDASEKKWVYGPSYQVEVHFRGGKDILDFKAKSNSVIVGNASLELEN